MGGRVLAFLACFVHSPLRESHGTAITIQLAAYAQAEAAQLHQAWVLLGLIFSCLCGRRSSSQPYLPWKHCCADIRRKDQPLVFLGKYVYSVQS